VQQSCQFWYQGQRAAVTHGLPSRRPPCLAVSGDATSGQSARSRVTAYHHLPFEHCRRTTPRRLTPRAPAAGSARPTGSPAPRRRARASALRQAALSARASRRPGPARLSRAGGTLPPDTWTWCRRAASAATGARASARALRGAGLRRGAVRTGNRATST